MPRCSSWLRDRVVGLRVEVAEGEVFQLRLELPDAEPVGERRVDLHRLLGDAELLVARHRAERAHVVQAVGQLDQDDADVVDHRQEHLAQVLGLLLCARGPAWSDRLAGPGDLAELGDAVDQPGDAVAELWLDLLQRDAGSPRPRRGAARRRSSRGRAASAPRIDRDLDRVDDVGLAGARGCMPSWASIAKRQRVARSAAKVASGRRPSIQRAAARSRASTSLDATGRRPAPPSGAGSTQRPLARSAASWNSHLSSTRALAASPRRSVVVHEADRRCVTNCIASTRRGRQTRGTRHSRFRMADGAIASRPARDVDGAVARPRHEDHRDVQTAPVAPCRMIDRRTHRTHGEDRLNR